MNGEYSTNPVLVRDYDSVDKVLSNGETLVILKFTQPPFDDIMFSFSRVQLTDEGTHAKLSFKYVLHFGELYPEDVQEFENNLGDFLTQLIEEGIISKELIYTGGVD